MGVAGAAALEFLLHGCGHRVQFCLSHSDYAMFHIFSGPLFANLEGYVFLDLLIWGVSPLLFEVCRTPLR